MVSARSRRPLRYKNDLVRQGALASTGALGQSRYFSLLLRNQFVFNPGWLGSLVIQAADFHHSERRNSHFGFALAFPFSSNFRTTSGLETFGDNQFITPLTAFPVQRDQQKHQLRYDVAHAIGTHAIRFGVNLIHEPVLSGRLSDNAETLISFPEDPGFYVRNPSQFVPDYEAGKTISGGSNGVFTQSVRRLGFYAQDAWLLAPSFTINIGLRYDTTFGLFRASGREQDQNPAFLALKALGIPLVPGIPHDYRGAIAPRFGIAWSPGGSGRTVVRGGVGLYYNDLAQNGWVNAFQAVNRPPGDYVQSGNQGALIDPGYKTPCAYRASLGIERALTHDWRLRVQYAHQQGVHEYRRYEYKSGVTLPAQAPDISLFRSDNRSRYDGLSIGLLHQFRRGFDLSAHYTLASAATWGGVAGEVFDYVNLVSSPRNAFGPGDHGPSGEDVRHRFVLTGTARLPGHIEIAALAQLESARPFTLVTPVDVNDDGDNTNDRAIVNGKQTGLDQLRGAPFLQVDLRVSRPIRFSERLEMRPFIEFLTYSIARTLGTTT